MIQVPPMILTQMISKPEVHPITLKASLMIEAHPVILYAHPNDFEARSPTNHLPVFPNDFPCPGPPIMILQLCPSFAHVSNVHFYLSRAGFDIFGFLHFQFINANNI